MCNHCLLSCKDTNLKAIHNVVMVAMIDVATVFYLAKILIWKQFTTFNRTSVVWYDCLLSCKDTNLKAIHNVVLFRADFASTVFYLAKILIWKQFTTSILSNTRFTHCLLSCKDTNLKAIHNPFEAGMTFVDCLLSCKDTNLKAIHNK